MIQPSISPYRGKKAPISATDKVPLVNFNCVFVVQPYGFCCAANNLTV